MAASLPPTLLSLHTSPFFSSQNSHRTENPLFILSINNRSLLCCSAKKKLSFVDQILDYIEGGPKLRKWYGAPDLLPKEGSDVEEDDFPEEDIRDAVLVTDGDSEIGQLCRW